MSVDPLAEEYPEGSSYNYVFSNPVKYIDPTGMGPELADDIILRMLSKITGKLEPILIIRTNKFKTTFDLKGEHFLINGITGAPDYAEVFLDKHLKINPDADAIGAEFAGSLTIGYGQSRSIMLGAFLDGPDEGKVFLYGDKSHNLGGDISPSLSLKTYFAQDEKSFNRFSLEGREVGLDLSAEGFGASGFLGLDNLFNIIYTGYSKSISPGIGPGRVYSSQTKLIEDLNYRQPDSQKYEKFD